VDRTSGKEMGGPYASRADAERAMDTFDKSPAELEIEEADEEEDGESTSKEGRLAGSQFPSEGTPQLGVDPGPSDPGIEPHEQAEPQEGVAPKSTKPSQLPSEGGGSMGSDLPSDVSSPQFDPASFSTDPVGNGVNAVAALVAEENPGLDDETARHVARRVMGMLVQAENWGWHPHMPHIEDPLGHHHPLHFLLHERERRMEERKKREEEAAAALEDGEEKETPAKSHDTWGEVKNREPDTWDEVKTSLPHGIPEEEIPDLSEFDKPMRPKRELPDYWWMREGSLPGTAGAWGWQPQMSEDIEDPLVNKSPLGDSQKQDKKDGGGSSIPGMPKIPGAEGAGEAEAGGAAAGAGEAAGGAALAEEALPLLLV
jgi:hypothetical protein